MNRDTAKQILICQRVRRINWIPDRGYWRVLSVCNVAQENVMNTCGEFVYSMLWIIKPKNITTISTMQIII
jgi:hypothetical protein